MISTTNDYTRNCKLGPETSMFTFLVVGRCRNRSESVSSSWAWPKTPHLPLELSSYLSSFKRYKYFRFWQSCRYFRLSLMLHSLFDTFRKLALVEGLPSEL